MSTLDIPVVPVTVSTGARMDPSADPSALLIANIYVSASSTVDNVTLIDTRTRGGGIDNDPTRLTGSQKIESQTLWDIATWDGSPAMVNGSIIINIPAAKLIENGGDMSPDQIEEIVKKNMPVGILPIINYTE